MPKKYKQIIKSKTRGLHYAGKVKSSTPVAIPYTFCMWHEEFNTNKNVKYNALQEEIKRGDLQLFVRGKQYDSKSVWIHGESFSKDHIFPKIQPDDIKELTFEPILNLPRIKERSNMTMYDVYIRAIKEQLSDAEDLPAVLTNIIFGYLNVYDTRDKIEYRTL